MKYFNALQLTILFAAWPHLIAWLSAAEFRGAAAAFWAAVALYVIQAAFTVVAYGEQM